MLQHCLVGHFPLFTFFFIILMKFMKGVLLLPTPASMSYFWNLGSLLGFYLFFQVLTGFFLSMKYFSFSDASFYSVDFLDREIVGGHLVHLFHVFGASIFFLFLYIHMSRGMYYGSYYLVLVWYSGVSILMLSMGVSFLGYVLPWGQMSYWGATVMTKFLSVVPYMGLSLVSWMWGGFSVDSPTLSRFFSLHFFLPFFLVFLVFLHLVFLHATGSTNPLSLGVKGDKVPFYPYFFLKDFYGIVMSLYLLVLFIFNYENFIESQNFIESKSLITPEHIQPEWYFLSAYAVLRAVPKKLGGVFCLVLFIAMLYFLPFLLKDSVFSCPLLPFGWWFWVFKFIFLIWLGSKPVEVPFMGYSQYCSLFYFLFFFHSVFKTNKSINISLAFSFMSLLCGFCAPTPELVSPISGVLISDGGSVFHTTDAASYVYVRESWKTMPHCKGV